MLSCRLQKLQWRYECVESRCVTKHAPLVHMDCPCLVPFLLHRFPSGKNEERHRQWLVNMERKNFNPEKSAVVSTVTSKVRLRRVIADNVPCSKRDVQNRQCLRREHRRYLLRRVVADAMPSVVRASRAFVKINAARKTLLVCLSTNT
ncbi:uncharacterized protein ISCGN_026207 [Ixodes scapularis]